MQVRPPGLRETCKGEVAVQSFDLKLLLAEDMLSQTQCGADRVEDESSSEDGASSCGNKEYISKNKQRSVEPQSNEEVKRYGVPHLMKTEEEANSSRGRSKG